MRTMARPLKHFPPNDATLLRGLHSVHLNNTPSNQGIHVAIDTSPFPLCHRTKIRIRTHSQNGIMKQVQKEW